mmetsp:Transcript_13485/g.40146  ORF Transcript_13485/g.40146 Transcript_13485/m.40146 type:complete len:107 (-) Transcript_13485:25-345(-)
MERIARHKQKLIGLERERTAEQRARKQKFAHLDMGQLREQAQRRAAETQRAQVLERAALALAVDAKRREAQARRDLEARAKERRRAEIYALNAIMHAHFRSIGAAD